MNFNIFEHFVFDLDRTLWDIVDPTGRPIWAKQTLPPYHIHNVNALTEKTTDTIIDDVGNICKLRIGVRDMLEFLHSNKKVVSYLSGGAVHGLHNTNQPSVMLLSIFGLTHLFNGDRILLYKTQNKAEHFPLIAKTQKAVFFDDDTKYLAEVSAIGVPVVNTAMVFDYTNMFGNTGLPAINRKLQTKKLTNEQELKIFELAATSRAFEEYAFNQLKNKTISIPTYLSAGEEYIAATLSVFLDHHGPTKRQIFIQHRGHSTYLSFGGDPEKLVLELLGHKNGCAGGMGGSASIHSKEKQIYGHDGLMGSQAPIATGMCFTNRIFTLCFAGDAAAEEDYFLASLGWAATKGLPILFIVEDNNFSILTEKKVRRSWDISDIAKSFGLQSCNVTDDPTQLWETLSKLDLSKPALLNVKTHRKFWHAGAGIDDPTTFDRQDQFLKKFGASRITTAARFVKDVWENAKNT